MEIEDIRKELNDLLENVVDHSSRYSAERPIPSLEISFVLSKVNKMQENLTILKYLLEQKERLSKQTTKTNKKEFVEAVKEDIIEQQPSGQTERIERSISVAEEVAVTDLPQEPIAKKPSSIEQPAIPKLIDALTLNDRYLYANELFDKDMNAFNELVKSIDNSPSLDEAKELFSSLGWDDEDEHVQTFTILVERRFI